MENNKGNDSKDRPAFDYCPKCEGYGETLDGNVCPVCGGSGVVGPH